MGAFITTAHPAPDVAVLTIDRDEKRNALTSEVCNELTDAIEQSVKDGIRAIVVTGAGSAFCAGADLSAGEPKDIYEAFTRLDSVIRTAPIAIIAYLNGPAIGAGGFMAIDCDIRIVSPTAKIALPVAKMGVPVSDYAAAGVAGAVGGSLARVMLMTGVALEADALVACGAARPGDLDAAIEVAKVCAAGDAGSIASLKQAFSPEK